MPKGSPWHGSNLYFTYEKLMPSSCSAHAKQNFKECKLLSQEHPDILQNWVKGGHISRTAMHTADAYWTLTGDK